MSHAGLQGSECDGEVEHACHMPDFKEVSNGKVEHTCYMPDFKEVSVMER